MMISGKVRDYLILSLTMVSAYYVIVYALVFIHEMAHGCAALVLGGHFPFMQVGISKGNAIYIFPMGSLNWKEIVVLVAGPLVNFLIAILILGLVVTGIKNQQKRLLLILVGGLSALGFIAGTGLLYFWKSDSGDVGRALGLLRSMPVYRMAIGAVWLLLGAAMVVSFLQVFFKELARFFPTATYRDRLLLVSSAIAIPALIIIGGQTLSALNAGESMNLPGQLLYAGLLLVVAFLHPLAIRSSSDGLAKQSFIMSPRVIAVFLIAATSLAVIQYEMFDSRNAKSSGLFLSRKPPEITVSACNVRLTIDEDYRARVQMLMRPFVSQQEFLWDRIKNDDPENWEYYERFVQENLPLMLGAYEFRIVNRYAGTQVPFFNGKWDSGARVIEAEVDLSRLPHLKGPQSNRVLKIVDFWRNQGAGYLDFTEIKVGGSLRINDFESHPDSAATPKLYSAKQLQWENSGFEHSFAVSYVAIR